MRRRQCRASLRAWCTEALRPLGQTPARHHLLLIHELERIARGEIDRLMVCMPPGHAKTEYATILFSAWFLAQADGLDVIGASYNQEYADRNSRKIIRLFQNYSEVLGVGLRSEAAGAWETTKRGTYRSAGVGAGITGRRADLIIIDDPVKGREEADSLTTRDKVWDWYRAEATTRLKPGARVVLILTRWHEDDPAGRLLDQMQTGGDQWHVVSLPAIAEENDQMGRAVGEALWPEWEDVPALERKRAVVGEREWAALFQQRPRPLEGSLFKIENIQVLEVAPNLRGAQIGSGWDLAATKQVGTRDPDWTVRVKLARLPSGLFVVLDVFRARGGPDEVDSWMLNLSTQDRIDTPGMKISIPEDPGQAGKAQVLAFTRLLSGFQIESSRETGDKATRAAPVVSQANGSNLAIVRAPWNRAFLDELAAFPSGTKDDQVDALSRAFSIVGLGARPLVVSDDVLAALGKW